MRTTGHLHVSCIREDRELSVRNEVERLGCLVDADEVLVADQDEGGRPNPAKLLR